MSTKHRAPRITRREFTLAATGTGAGAVLAACAPAAAPPSGQPTTAAATTAPGQTPRPAAEAPGAAAPQAPQQVKQVPRNKTLVLMWAGKQGKYDDHELWNPYAVGANHQNGPGLFYEPLYFYSAFADKMIPWLAESHQYSSDFKQLTIKTRSGITWSDGRPFSADDVAFTLAALVKQGSNVRWGVDVQQFVDDVRATDANTVAITFKVPAPKFLFFMAYKYDIGVYPVPKHIFQDQADWARFTHYDLAKGWPVTTGPWRLVYSSPDQKIIDRRDSWWAATAGLAPLPKVERIVYLPNPGETQMAQAYITNQIDCSLDLRPNTIKTVIAQNPKIITHSGRELPYGYVDWWPTSLYVNNEKAPFNDKDVRWAISHFIDRKQVIDVGYGGAGTTYPLPLPSYPGLKPFVDAVRPQLNQYDTLEFNPAKGADLLTKKGFRKNSAGVWTDSSGAPIKLEIGGFEIFADIGPVIAEQLKRQGIDASYIMPPDMFDRFSAGDYTGMLFGHGGSVSGDPYFTLRLYQTASAAVPGSHLVNFSRWKNDAYDQVVDEMATVPPEDQQRLLALFKQAMNIWLPELPDIQIVEWYHRIPMNTTYWKGWPTKDNPYVNGAFWHLTFPLILHKLEPAQ